MMVRAPDINAAVETALQFIEVIRDIRSEVSAHSIVTDHDAVFFVTKTVDLNQRAPPSS